MRKIVAALAGTVSGLVMLFSYYTSTAGIAAPAAGVTTGTTSTSGTTPTTGTTSTTGTTPTTAASSGGTFTGSAASTRWGPVQVKVTVSGGRISTVTVVVYPQGNPRDDEINSYALPILKSETIAAQSAQIDHVSGATDTSDGYVTSLQSALDQAHL